MTKPPGPGKIYAIQNLRGLAAISVCIFHLSSNLNSNDLVKQYTVFGYLGVQVFFVISGFVIPWALYHEKYRIKYFFSYLLKRALRIEPPYILSIVLILLLNFLSSKLALYQGGPFHLNINQFLLHTVFLNDYFGFDWLQPVYHTLQIEFEFYILMGLFFPLLISNKKTVIYCIIAVLLITSYLRPVALFYFIDLFLVGIIYFKYRINHLKKNEFMMLEASVVAFTLINNTDKYVAVAELFTLVCIIYWTSNNYITQFLGKISYSLYLLHVPIGGKLINLGQRYFYTAYMQYLVIIIALSITIFCSWLLYKWIELPSITLSKRIVKNFK